RLSVARRQSATALAEARSTREFIQGLTSHFERVVVATGVPQAAVAVAPALAIEADAVVIVVRPGRTRRQTVTTALTALRELGAPVVGIVLSDE
ncbi:MAG: chain-length determining protein, partial [Chloroflexota bacterium]